MEEMTANLQVQLDSTVKEQAEEILAQLGAPPQVVIEMLYRQIILTRSIPFSVSIPSSFCDEVEASPDASQERENPDTKRSAADLFANLRRELQHCKE